MNLECISRMSYMVSPVTALIAATIILLFRMAAS